MDYFRFNFGYYIIKAAHSAEIMIFSLLNLKNIITDIAFILINKWVIKQNILE